LHHRYHHTPGPRRKGLAQIAQDSIVSGVQLFKLTPVGAVVGDAIRLRETPMTRHSSKLDWARVLMEHAGVSQRDVARAWEVSESSVSRWLDGLQASDISAGRVVTFARLVRKPVEEILARLGYKVWREDGSEAAKPLHPVSGPSVGTTNLRSADRPGWFYLLLHLELPAREAARIIESMGATSP
jgi:predicted XRE-type DNA-binding protein